MRNQRFTEIIKKTIKLGRNWKVSLDLFVYRANSVQNVFLMERKIPLFNGGERRKRKVKQSGRACSDESFEAPALYKYLCAILLLFFWKTS